MPSRTSRRVHSGNGAVEFLKYSAKLAVVGAGCFAIGFFAISRFGGQAKPPPPPPPSTASNSAPHGQMPPIHRPPHRMPHAPAAGGDKMASAPAPFIGPATEPIDAGGAGSPNATQVPGAVDAGQRPTPPASSAAQPSTPAPQPRTRRHHRQPPEEALPQGVTVGDGRPGQSGGPPAQQPGTQPAQSPGSTTAAAQQPADTAAPKRSGLYRVQTGVFSTREAADRQAEAVRGAGFTVSVRAVDVGGRTMYRVQHATYRHRANAQAELDRMKAAGVDASIINP